MSNAKGQVTKSASEQEMFPTAEKTVLIATVLLNNTLHSSI